MANYHYQALDENGMNVTGTIEAESPEMAEKTVLSLGYIPVATKLSGKAGDNSFLDRILDGLSGIKITDLILFTKQFRSMLRAGIPIIRLLLVLENQTPNKKLKRVVATVSQDIKSGSSLYEAMKKHTSVFSPLYLSMINAGEVSGSLPDVLDRLIGIIGHEAKIKSDIKSAMQYPIIVVIALGIAFFVLLTFVIPKFVAIFARAKLALPLPTKVAMWLYQALANYWFIVIAGVLGLIIGLVLLFKTPQGRYLRDAFFLKMPLFGPLFQKAAMSRFASIFAILQSSGVPVMKTMEVLSTTIGNSAISHEFELITELIKEGKGISGPLGSAKYFTPMVVDMVAIGEESGNIEEMMQQVSLHYDDEVAYAVKGLSDALGPILIVGLASVVGFFALAIFLPMWDLTKLAH
jgi:type II secretory pathway component PulF